MNTIALSFIAGIAVYASWLYIAEVVTGRRLTLDCQTGELFYRYPDGRKKLIRHIRS